MDTKAFVAALLLAPLLLAASPRAPAIDRSAFGVTLEGGGVWFSRNDVRIPGDTGTRFDLLRLTGTGPDGYFRLRAHWNITPRHGLRIGVAPLEVSGTGNLDKVTRFAGETFSPGRTRATYRFSTYRLTYRYTFAEGPAYLWRVGFTGLVRDAKIQLDQGAKQARDTNVGFVPLLHLDGRMRIAPGWSFVLDFDGLASSQGRALDLAIQVQRDLGEHWRLGGGYRTLEGGADNDEVYNFAWLHYGFASLSYRF
ncbi:MAG TPA: hypothetical protein VKA48_11985 [Gammaproteobacteria bacterium]|nr:hypothetical protein [Gammaproteobacteria bacterium]